MKWTIEAEDAIKKIPFFVRKRVRSRVEKEAEGEGKPLITIAEVKATQARFLSKMETDIKGYQIETCFGAGGCPNRANAGDGLMQKLEALLAEENLLDFLKKEVKGGLKYHHEFRITLADCPNACSQPQIKDIGIIGACIPEITQNPCSQCEACMEACREQAIFLETGLPVMQPTMQPTIQMDRCLYCGQCIQVCPTGTLGAGTRGYRVLLGGKLGRHPRLARELSGVFSEKAVLSIVKDCLSFYRLHSRGGERFAEIFTEQAFEETSACIYSNYRLIEGISDGCKKA
ncbi:MAG: 4Fe-4S dicluster domain-containing protein [Pseudomonadota bacterium]